MNKILFTVVLLSVSVWSWSSADAQTPIDVFFLAGQSNAGNIGEQNGVGSTDVGFNLDYGRIVDRPPAGTGPNDIVDTYSSNLLDLNQNVNQLAVGLHDQNDLGIYSFGRNGRPLANLPDANDEGESWNRNAGELYDDFIAWGNQRLTDLVNAGFAPEVRGIFWFQGEGDAAAVENGVNLNAALDYEDNYTDLIDGFRQDFTPFGGDDLVVVSADLRSVGSPAREAINQTIRDATANVAALDPLVGTISTTDANGIALEDRFGPGDVHFSNDAQEIIVNRFADEFNSIVAASAVAGDSTVPEPSSFTLIALCGCGLLGRRKRS